MIQSVISLCKSSLFILLLFLAISTQSAAAGVLPVSNPDEFKQACAKARPGDEIVIKNGTYTNWSVEIPVNGEAQKNLVVRAEKAGEVVFTGSVNAPLFRVTGNHITLSGFQFSKCILGKAENKSGLLVEITGSDCRLTQSSFHENRSTVQFTPLVIIGGNGERNRVDHCSFAQNVDNQEVQVKITGTSAPQFTLIDHNEFRDKPKVSWSNSNGGECVQVGQDPVLLGTRVAHTTVRDNRFLRCNGEPEVISNKSASNNYVGNYFEDNDGELVMRGGHDCLIDSNTFKGGAGGIRVNGTHHTITNNRFSGIRTAIRLMYGMSKGREEIGFYVAASECIVKNNHISGAVTGILVGDSKNADWAGKFDTKRYPSRTMQDVAPTGNVIEKNEFSATATNVKEN